MNHAITQQGQALQSWSIMTDGEIVNYHQYTLCIHRNTQQFNSIKQSDWLLICNPKAEVIAIARVYRIRYKAEKACIYLDKEWRLELPVSLSKTELSLPTQGQISRLQWTSFSESIPQLCNKTLADIPLIEDVTYVRELLQLAVNDDLLGPAKGPNEHIVDMGVRDRYLVGKLAPVNTVTTSSSDLESDIEEDKIHTGYDDQGEFNSATGRTDPESDASDEKDSINNQSLVPSNFGITFCVDGDVKAIEIDLRWGRYERLHEHGYTKTVKKKTIDKEGNEAFEDIEVKAKVWQRIPCGGKIILELTEGVVSRRSPDNEQPQVCIQGSIRGKNQNGDRLVTLFLRNTQEEPETNRDSAWIFQPEIIVRATDDSSNQAIFRRRPLLDSHLTDPERKSLEMIYRKEVEYAVGHGVSVHASVTDDSDQATEVRSVVIPEYEVPMTETPGLNDEDRPAMKKMVTEGHLDMTVLAEMDKEQLIETLSILTQDYANWIKEQQFRVDAELPSYLEQAETALGQCNHILQRLNEGIDTLAKNKTALTAFRFANQAMAQQRIHGIYSLRRRRGEKITLKEIDKPKNRSWRPFQLAFVLLSIPALADPEHKDRTEDINADADLLWFPTGGGKTEAYLGVAAFTMAIRRLQGDLGGYDSSRGLAVIMRYTLRLLTLQQFQRGTALICAMEVLRRSNLAKGETSLGEEPFTIGLWVGERVTPNTTQKSHEAIETIRNPDKYSAGASSPAQLTSCPWCGSEIEAGRDIEVNREIGQTSIYCGDKKGRCEFSRGKSSKLKTPGIPVLVVDEEIYRRPPSMMIATVDKFAMMAWRGEVKNLFGRATQECLHHGLLWPDSPCSGNHPARNGLPKSTMQAISLIRPPDLIIQDEFHLISGPLGTMVGLYETAVDELSTWQFNDKSIKPKVIASTATVRKANEQVKNVFMRKVSVFPPHGLDVEDNFFSVQRSIDKKPGRRYLGICSPGSSRPAMLIRIYTAYLTAAQALFNRFGEVADPYLTTVGYFNSLRELGGMKRLAEDDVQTRSYRVKMSMVERPGLDQRSVRSSGIRELTSRVSSQDIPKYLDQLELKFSAVYNNDTHQFEQKKWQEGEDMPIDIVLATNMLSVGVDVNRLGLMVVNGQPKGTAEYIQATSRVGRQFPGLVCTVLTWARPRDLSHYETFEHYHATFYKHVEAQSVTPFSPRAIDRGLTGTMLSILRLEHDDFNPNTGADELDDITRIEAVSTQQSIVNRTYKVTDLKPRKDQSKNAIQARYQEWLDEVNRGGRTLGYEKKGTGKDTMVALLKKPGISTWDNFTVPMSMREVEPGVRLIMNIERLDEGPKWKVPPLESDKDKNNTDTDKFLKELVGKPIEGNVFDIELPNNQGVRQFRFLSKGENKPNKGSLVIVAHKDISQKDTVNGFAIGKLGYSILQDAATGKKQINMKIRGVGAPTSLKVLEDEWNAFYGFAVPVTKF